MTDSAETSQATAAFYSTIGRNIRAARKARGLAQADLGKAVGLTRSSISNIEAGRQHPALHVMAAIAQALQVEFSALVTGDLPELVAADPRPGYRHGWNACLKAVRDAVNNQLDLDVVDGNDDA